MKKLVILSLVIALIVIACSRRSVATREPVIPQREASITPVVTESNSNASSSIFANVATDEATITLGKNVYEAKCGRCHGLKAVSVYTSQRWEAILKTMAPRARLTEPERQQVAAYIHAHSKK